MWLKEMTAGVEKETELVIKDYTNLNVKKIKFLLNEMSYDSVLDEASISKLLGHESLSNQISARGWRILSKTSLSDSEIASLFEELPTIKEIINSDLETYGRILGPEKAGALKVGLNKIKGVA